MLSIKPMRTLPAPRKPSRRTPVPAEVAICQDNAAGHVSYVQDAVNQSRADANGVSLADYIHATFGLLLQAKARHVLLIGCGGGTLATMLRARDVRVTMVDINETSFAIARQHFRLPRSVQCHVADGLAFLRDRTKRYDAIVLDAYDGAKIPKQFLKPAFMRLVQTRLTGPHPCFIVNVIAKKLRDPYVREVADLLQAVWDDVRILGDSTGGDHNALVMAGDVAAFKRPKLEMPPLVDRTDLRQSLARMKFRS